MKLVAFIGLPAAGQAVSDHEKCSLLQALQTNGVQVSVSCTVLVPNAQYCGSALLSIRIRIQLFIAMRMRFQGVKPMRNADPCGMRIHADPDSDHSQTLNPPKLDFYMKNTYF